MARTRNHIETKQPQNGSKTEIPNKKTNSPSKKKNTVEPKLKKVTDSRRSPLKSSNEASNAASASSRTRTARLLNQRRSPSEEDPRSSRQAHSNETPRSSRQAPSNETPGSSRQTSSNKDPRSARTPSTNSTPRQPVSPQSQMPGPSSKYSRGSSSLSNSSSSMESASSTDQSSRSPSPAPLPAPSNQRRTTPSQKPFLLNHPFTAETEQRLEEVFQEMLAKYGMKFKIGDAVKMMMEKTKVKQTHIQKWVSERKRKEKDNHPNHISKQNVEKLEEVYKDLKEKWPNVPFLPTEELARLSEEIKTSRPKILTWLEARRTNDRNDSLQIAPFGLFNRHLKIIRSDDLDKFQSVIDFLRELHRKKFGDESSFKLYKDLAFCLVKYKDNTKEEWEKLFETVSKKNNYPANQAKFSVPEVVPAEAPNDATTSTPNEEEIEITSKLDKDQEVLTYMVKAYRAQNHAGAKRVGLISANIHEPKELIARWFIDRKYKEDLETRLKEHDEKAAEDYENSPFFSPLPDHLKAFVTAFIQTAIDLQQYEKESEELHKIPGHRKVKQLMRHEREKRSDVQTSFIEEKTKKITEDEMEILEEKFLPSKLKFLEETIDLKIATPVIKAFHEKKTRPAQQADEEDIEFLGHFVKDKHAFLAKKEPVNVDQMGGHRRLPQTGQRAAPRILMPVDHRHVAQNGGQRAAPRIVSRHPQPAQNVVHPRYDPYDPRTVRDVLYPHYRSHGVYNPRPRQNVVTVASGAGYADGAGPSTSQPVVQQPTGPMRFRFFRRPESSSQGNFNGPSTSSDH